MQSVGFTAVPLFVIAAVWFLAFGLCLCLICLFRFCRKKESYGYSKTVYVLSLIVLIILTITTMYISLSLSLSGVKLNFCNKLMYCTVVTVLDALFYILVRRGFTVVQQIHWSMLYIRQISQLRSSGTCQIILVQLSRLEWIKFFSLQMFKLILTRLKPRLILLLVPLLAEQWRIQKTCMISWILCNEEL